MPSIRPRLSLIDFLRTLTIFSMLAFHICFDHNVIFGGDNDWPFLPSIRFWQQTIVLSFIFISGMSFRLMQPRLRLFNALRLLLIGFGITMYTIMFMPSQPIIYGVLTFMGSALLLSLLLENERYQLLSKIPIIPALAANLICFLLCYHIQLGNITLGPLLLGHWPQALYDANLAYLGFPGESFFSADYVTFLPHIFMYWLGFYTLELIEKKYPQILRKCDFRRFNFLGRHSLSFYLLHQPIILALMSLIR